MMEKVNIPKFHGDWDFCFLDGEFLHLFHENEANMTNLTLRENHDIWGKTFVKLLENLT